MNLTLEHASQCSPLILEVDSTFRTAQDRFKGANVSFLSQKGQLLHLNAATHKDCSRAHWTQQNLDLVFCHSALESALYEAVKAKAACNVLGVHFKSCISRFFSLQTPPVS